MSSTEQDIGETIMRAFILRRTAFIIHSEAGATLIGGKADRDLIRMQRFLTRNGYPTRVFDPAEKETEEVASECGLGQARGLGRGRGLGLHQRGAHLSRGPCRDVMSSIRPPGDRAR